jgi:hypothetical protein
VGPKAVVSPMLVRLWFGRASEESEYRQPVHWAEAGNRVIADALAQGAPCMITRLGSGEVGVVSYYLRWRAGRGIRFPYPGTVRRALNVNAGFFPADDASLDAFARLYLESIRDADVMAVWFSRGEQYVVTRYCDHARYVELGALLGMLYPSPWSAQLAGKRVLVIHPFARTIASQYEQHRMQLFADPLVLPEFELQTLAPPQTIAGNTQGFASWFDALDRTCEQIARATYDIALIGAGAYGLPIAAFVKRQGRQAVHTGGVTQLFFGIKGRRWELEYQEGVVPLFNDFWVRPSAEETPSGASRVEGGCYW